MHSSNNPVMEDNKGAMTYSTEGFRYAKHASISQKFVKENVDNGVINRMCCSTDRMSADILEKPMTFLFSENPEMNLALKTYQGKVLNACRKREI